MVEDESQCLALVLSMDGIFILELLRTLAGHKFSVAETSNYYVPIFDRNKIDFTGFDIIKDILMLENQIPLIVLLNPYTDKELYILIMQIHLKVHFT